MTRIGPLFLGVALIAGCSGSAQYTEADNRRTIDADVGTTFSVSLPASHEPVKAEFSTNLLELASDTKDEAKRRRILAFQARMTGETDIRVGKEFSIHVRVTSASDRPGMHVHTR
jgi:hypothetical protein